MSSEDDSYGFEYSDEEMSEGAVDIENQYYNSKGNVESSNLEEALKGFLEVLRMEEEKGEWGFKAYKQIVKLQFRMGKHDEMLESYRKMLEYASGAVTRNQAEKKLNSLLDFMSTCQDKHLLQKFYETTLQSEEGCNNERLWFKANLKLCDLWFQSGDFVPLARALKLLNQKCTTKDGLPDLKKATLLLEVYAIEIQMYSAQKNFKKLKELYDKSLSIKSAIPHPRIMGTVRECGGKMHMREKAWQAAHTDFFEAFKSYDDAGSPRRVQCLKYLVLASMLMESHVDPFNAQETKPYRSDPEIQAMTDLVEAYQNSDINKFERTLKANRNTVIEDPFIRPYVEDLITVLRTQVLLKKVIGPYTRVKIPFLASKINCDAKEAERLLASLIMDGRIEGHIDQVQQLLVLAKHREVSDDAVPVNKYAQMDRIVDLLSTMQKSLLSRAAM